MDAGARAKAKSEGLDNSTSFNLSLDTEDFYGPGLIKAFAGWPSE
jgi:hypothetical protein